MKPFSTGQIGLLRLMRPIVFCQSLRQPVCRPTTRKASERSSKLNPIRPIGPIVLLCTPFAESQFPAKRPMLQRSEQGIQFRQRRAVGCLQSFHRRDPAGEFVLQHQWW